MIRATRRCEDITFIIQHTIQIQQERLLGSSQVYQPNRGLFVRKYVHRSCGLYPYMLLLYNKGI